MAGCGVVVRRFARVVKGLDLKSNGCCPRRFEPCSRRFVIMGDVVCIVVHCGSWGCVVLYITMNRYVCDDVFTRHAFVSIYVDVAL